MSGDLSSKELVDSLMEDVQSFASAWSLVGGRFDSGNMLEDAESQKAELRDRLVGLCQRLEMREELVDGYEKQLGIADADATITVGSEIARLLEIEKRAAAEPCAIHAAEHRVRDTLPCPWCVIDELKRNRDSAIPPPAVTGEAIDAARAALKSDTNVTYPSHVAARQVRHVIRELVSAYERLHTLYTATCATYCHEHERASPPPGNTLQAHIDYHYSQEAAAESMGAVASERFHRKSAEYLERIKRGEPPGESTTKEVQHAVTCKLFPDPHDERQPKGPCTCGAETKSGVTDSVPIGEVIAEQERDPEMKREMDEARAARETSSAHVVEEGCAHCAGVGLLGHPPSRCPFCSGEGVRRRDSESEPEVHRD